MYSSALSEHTPILWAILSVEVFKYPFSFRKEHQNPADEKGGASSLISGQVAICSDRCSSMFLGAGIESGSRSSMSTALFCHPGGTK